MLLFIVLYLVGEIIENTNLNTLSSLSELGSQIHVIATVYLTILFWTRYFYSEKYSMQMIDDDIDEVPKDNSNMNK
jgi:hypothetical protein